MCVCLLAALEGSLRAPPLLSDCSLRGAPALLFRAVIGQGPPAELVCSSFVAPRFRSPLKASLWQDATSAASPSSFTLLRPRIQTHGFVRRLPRPRYHDLELRGEGRGRTGYAHRQKRERERARPEQRDMFNGVLGNFVLESQQSAWRVSVCLPPPPSIL